MCACACAWCVCVRARVWTCVCVWCVMVVVSVERRLTTGQPTVTLACACAKGALCCLTWCLQAWQGTCRNLRSGGDGRKVGTGTGSGEHVPKGSRSYQECNLDSAGSVRRSCTRKWPSPQCQQPARHTPSLASTEDVHAYEAAEPTPMGKARHGTARHGKRAQNDGRTAMDATFVSTLDLGTNNASRHAAARLSFEKKGGQVRDDASQLRHRCMDQGQADKCPASQHHRVAGDPWD